MSNESRTRFYVHENFEVHLSFQNQIFIVNTLDDKTEYPRLEGCAVIYPQWKGVPVQIDKVVREHFSRKRFLKQRIHAEEKRTRLCLADLNTNPFLEPALAGVVHYVKNWENFGSAVGGF